MLGFCFSPFPTQLVEHPLDPTIHCSPSGHPLKAPWDGSPSFCTALQTQSMSYPPCTALQTQTMSYPSLYGVHYPMQPHRASQSHSPIGIASHHYNPKLHPTSGPTTPTLQYSPTGHLHAAHYSPTGHPKQTQPPNYTPRAQRAAQSSTNPPQPPTKPHPIAHPHNHAATNYTPPQALQLLITHCSPHRRTTTLTTYKFPLTPHHSPTQAPHGPCPATRADPLRVRPRPSRGRCRGRGGRC